MGIHYNVIRVYPLFGGQNQKRSKFSNLEIFDRKERLTVYMLRVNGIQIHIHIFV